MPENGLTRAAERRQEFVDAEAALRARPRSAEEIAGDLTPAEEAEIIAHDERLAAAKVATQAVQQALTAARGPGILTLSGAVVAAGAKDRQALAAATTAEETALVNRVRLHEQIGAARQARRQEAAR
jgi:hypothetical protein